jgi:hypothetical protein
VVSELLLTMLVPSGFFFLYFSLALTLEMATIVTDGTAEI